jgi:hypothetical protein
VLIIKGLFPQTALAFCREQGWGCLCRGSSFAAMDGERGSPELSIANYSELGLVSCVPSLRLPLSTPSILCVTPQPTKEDTPVYNIIYLIGAIVVIVVILRLLGLW